MADPAPATTLDPIARSVDARGGTPPSPAGLAAPKRKWVRPAVDMIPTGLEVTAYIATE